MQVDENPPCRCGREMYPAAVRRGVGCVLRAVALNDSLGNHPIPDHSIIDCFASVAVRAAYAELSSLCSTGSSSERSSSFSTRSPFTLRAAGAPFSTLPLSPPSPFNSPSSSLEPGGGSLSTGAAEIGKASSNDPGTMFIHEYLPTLRGWRGYHRCHPLSLRVQ